MSGKLAQVGGERGRTPRWRLALLAGLALLACGLLVCAHGVAQAATERSEGTVACEAILGSLDQLVPASGESAEDDPASLPVLQLRGVDVVGRLTAKGISLDLPVAALGTDSATVPCLEQGNGNELVVRCQPWHQGASALGSLAKGDEVTFTQVDGATRTYRVADSGETSQEFNDHFDLLVYYEGQFGSKHWVGCSQSS